MQLELPFFTSRDAASLSTATHLILPGVGHFQEAMEHLEKYQLTTLLKGLLEENRQRLLGICLGMQVLASQGFEGGAFDGLDIIKGKVVELPKSPRARVPQIGWNELLFDPESYPAIMADIQSGETAYFNHAYHMILDEKIPSSWTFHDEIPALAALQKQNIFGVQFHPEKSQSVGRRILQQFVSY